MLGLTGIRAEAFLASAIFCAVLDLVAGSALAAEDEAPPMRVGMTVVTRAENPALRPGEIHVTYRGPIAFPLAENLEDVFDSARPPVNRLTLRLDSEGGSMRHLEDVMRVADRIRAAADFITVVEAGDTCASACIPLFMKGEERLASGASAWGFHGACQTYTNIPSTAATRLYLDMLKRSGVSQEFLCRLEDQGAFAKPGAYWLSGYELHAVMDAGVITSLLPRWVPEEPAGMPGDPALRPR